MIRIAITLKMVSGNVVALQARAVSILKDAALILEICGGKYYAVFAGSLSKRHGVIAWRPLARVNQRLLRALDDVGVDDRLAFQIRLEHESGYLSCLSCCKGSRFFDQRIVFTRWRFTAAIELIQAEAPGKLIAPEKSIEAVHVISVAMQPGLMDEDVSYIAEERSPLPAHLLLKRNLFYAKASGIFLNALYS